MPSSWARPLADSISRSNIRTWSCFGRLSIFRLASSVFGWGRAYAPGRFVPKEGTRPGPSSESFGTGARRGGQELFRGLCTRNRPLALLRVAELTTLIEMGKDYNGIATIMWHK